MYQVTVVNDGFKFWLRKTVWTSDESRADKFDSQEAAQAAVNKAEKFMHKKIRKALKIEEV